MKPRITININEQKKEMSETDLKGKNISSPLKMDDLIFVIIQSENRVHTDCFKIKKFKLDYKNNLWFSAVNTNKYEISFSKEEIGKSVFLTYDEAVSQIAKLILYGWEFFNP